MKSTLYPLATYPLFTLFLCSSVCVSVLSIFLGAASSARAEQVIAAASKAVPQTNTIINPLNTKDDTQETFQPIPDSSSTNYPASNLANRGYLLGVGDEVQVSVFNASDYSGEFSVLPGGVLNIPLVGEILVEGLTLQQASDDVSARISEYVRRPRVTISLLEARPLQVAIAGEVNRPGSYTLSDEGENSSATPTLTQAISMAGGITQSADIRQVLVQRRFPTASRAASQAASQTASLSTRQSGSQTVRQSTDQASTFSEVSSFNDASTPNEVTTFNVGSSRAVDVYVADDSSGAITVNLWQLLQEGQIEADLPLQRGDRIFIPTATALSPEESLELASASFSPAAVTVNVVGEVESPGAISLPPNPSLNQAILSAGGFNRRARRNSVSLIRLNEDGTATQQEIDIDFESGVNLENNPFLQPNDTVVVRTGGLYRATDTLGTVLSPLNSGFGLLRLFGL